MLDLPKLGAGATMRLIQLCGSYTETLERTGSSLVTTDSKRRVEKRQGGIVFADVHGYSRLIAVDEEAAYRAVAATIEFLGERVTAFNGSVVHVAGDGFLSFFESVIDAVRFAVGIHTWMKERQEEEPPDLRIEFRVGVNRGEVIADQTSIFGESVVTARRLEELAEPGGTCVSDAVFQVVREVLDLGYEYIGPQRLKGMAKNVDAYRLHEDRDAGMMTAGVRASADLARSLEDWLLERPSVAVLPFRNLSGDSADECFVDGVTEDIITNLSRFRNIAVIARNSSFVYKQRNVPIADVFRSLGVRYAVIGSIQKTAGKVRVRIQLIDANSEKSLWAENYDRDLADIFAIQDDITALAVSAMSVQIEAAERARMHSLPPSKLEAYALVLEGQERTLRYRRDDIAFARRLYHSALDADPRYSRAFAAISRTHNLDWRYAWSTSPEVSLETAMATARTAIDLDPSDARGYAEMGFVHLYQREHEASISAYERAIQLNPNDADILAEMADALTHSGRPDEALKMFKQAMRLNPFYPDQYLWYMAGAHFKVGDYEEAISTICRMKNMTEGRRLLAASYAHLGRLSEARREASLVRQSHPNITADYWRQRLPDRYEDTAEHFIEGLRIAGL